MLRSYILSSALLEVTGFWEEKDLEDVEGRSLDLVGGGTTKQFKSWCQKCFKIRQYSKPSHSELFSVIWRKTSFTLISVKFYTGICHFSPICLIYFVNTIMNSLWYHKWRMLTYQTCRFDTTAFLPGRQSLGHASATIRCTCPRSLRLWQRSRLAVRFLPHQRWTLLPRTQKLT